MSKITTAMLEKAASALRQIGPLKEANKRLKRLVEEETPRLLKLAQIQDFVIQQVVDGQLDPSMARDETFRLLECDDLDLEKRAYERGYGDKSYNGFGESVSTGSTDYIEKSARGWPVIDGEEIDPVTSFLLEVREEIHGIPNPISHVH